MTTDEKFEKLCAAIVESAVYTFEERVQSEWANFARNALMSMTKIGETPTADAIIKSHEIADKMIAGYTKRFFPKDAKK